MKATQGRLILLGIAMTIAQCQIIAQDTLSTSYIPGHHNVFGTLLGDGTVFSINYEYLLAVSENDKLRIAGSLGLGYDVETNLSGFLPYVLTIPMHLVIVAGRNHGFEAGIGGTKIPAGPNNGIIKYPIIGYRYMGPIKFLSAKNAVLRIYGMYFPDWKSHDYVIIPGGVSFGYNF